MSADAAGAITVRTVAAFLIATWPRRVIAGVLVLAPAVVAALGGFDAAEPRSVEVPAGQTLDLGRMSVTPESYFVSDETGRWALEGYPDAEAFLGVILTVENTDAHPLTVTFTEIFIPLIEQFRDAAGAGVFPDRVVRVQDGTLNAVLMPGLTSRVALLWPIEDASSVQDGLRLGMIEEVWAWGTGARQNIWQPIGDIWIMELPQVDLPESMWEPER